ncbi:MAG: TM0106 family RecB-like putative nuclease [Acidimicrobiaceae bacterium]|nr:TM0106 family RecB-like putative nuclease [Acidimicrobiaceae bacterium]
MSSPLRGAEIDACIHRIALSRAEPSAALRTPISPEQERRQSEADRHRREVIERLKSLHPDAVKSIGPQHTVELMGGGVALILQPRIIDNPSARRSASVQALLRVGRSGQQFSYCPLIVKNHEVTEIASSRSLHEGNFERLLPTDVVVRKGIGLRSTPTVRRDGLILSGAVRILQGVGYCDPGNRGAIIDRHQRLWWLDLAETNLPRINLAAYDALYRERIDVLRALDEWSDVGGPFPTSPYWHRECLTCEFSSHCQGELESADDVSLARFTNLNQQRALRQAGIETRAKLARLDPVRAQRARLGGPPDQLHSEDVLSPVIERLDELIYRARAHVRSSFLRIVEPQSMGCPTADVEVDVDMESFDDVTYLWGAHVTLNRPVADLEPGYHSFVEWKTLDRMSESRVFVDFWTWFSEVRQQCHDQGRTFAAYCFWAQAEDGAMNRAVSNSLDGGPTIEDLEAFRRNTPPEWFDLHDFAKQQIQTEGPLGLKQLASAAGFEWRDENPSGEASMLWYEIAVGGDSSLSALSRQRILEYNEDDCRATKALRDWLNGPAKQLAHRDDPI